ncbi:DNA primase [Algoriphagus sp. NBT04N3]|uniref:CHC2 zinc finger domain-containing protein n=1 Tax=Algoriphagus sp. NBT04N3 TaxID=2705473 RepID=UPI001C627259|nr:CHC2 zinc finger domain-containing protein [Algoriphagus sp. NBT04N3]QYH39536.1 DNA primase [Algoriphagus sp. NBT04N3]
MEITEIKTRLTLKEVLEHYGLKPDKQLRLNCPFHPDRTPSMQVYYKTQTAYCFSSNCPTHGKSLDVIDFIMHKESCSKHEAIKKSERLLAGNVSPAQELTRVALLTNMFTYFRNAVHNSKPAREYLESRGLDYGKTEIGYNSGQFHHGTRKDEALIEACLKYGLLLDKGQTNNRTGERAYSPFGKGGIVFPLKNQQNQIVSLYFRSTADDRQARHFYLRDRQGLYPKYPKPETTKLILTEAIIDAATLLQIPGIATEHEILACYGTNGLTEEHIKAIQSLNNLEEIIFFFDGDAAGLEGARKQGEKLKGLLPEIKISRVNTPESEDVNSLYINHADSAEALFTHLLDSRTSFDAPNGSFYSSNEPVSNEKKEIREQIQSTVPEPPKPTPSQTISQTKTNTQKPPQPIPQPKTNAQKPTSGPSLAAGSFDSTNPHRIIYFTDTAHYYVKGGVRQEPDRLQISLMVEGKGNGAYNRYRNRLDLYENKQTERIAREAAEKLNLRADLLELDLCRLTDLLEDYRDSRETGQKPESARIVLDSTKSGHCKDFLSKPNLIQRFNGLIGKAGVVGEENNRVFLFCIAASYGMPDTLHALIQGSSGSGKTHLLVKISSFIPDEDVKRFTRVTESSFYNYGMYDLKNKLICLEDLDGMKEEAQLAFRELQSREMLSSSTTGQDEKGNNRAYEKTVYGPIASMACTTKGEIYEDNMNRCFLIAVDETKEQTQRIIAYQNQKASGKIDGQEERKTTEFIQNCVRMLKPHEVVNPYADRVNLPEEAHKIRRLNGLYQSFVKQMTLMNQYRRKKDQKREIDHGEGRPADSGGNHVRQHRAEDRRAGRQPPAVLRAAEKLHQGQGRGV